MNVIRRADKNDLARLAEIYIFNYRLYFYPIFQNDDYYFGALQVPRLMRQFESLLGGISVYDDGVVKGFIQMEGTEIKKLFVEPVLHGASIGSSLLDYAVTACRADFLWALEKNVRAIAFYERHGFHATAENKLEDGTNEYLICLRR